MGKKIAGLSMLALLSLTIAACGSENGGTAKNDGSDAGGQTNQAAQTETNQASTETNQAQAGTNQAQAGTNQAANQTETTSAQTAESRTIDYLGQSYTVPAKADHIVIAGSLEAMEDALELGVNPTGGIVVGGKFPAMFAGITGATASIGEKTQPNMEAILQLKPDVILGSTKFPAEVGEQLAKIGTTIPVSHISTNWEANLRLMGELSGKQDEADRILKQYKDDIAGAKAQLSDKLKDKKVIAVRIRSGNIMLYSPDTFLNPTLYEDLGIPLPEEVKAAKSQETISLEKFSEMNPDYLFIQFSEEENKNKPKAFEALENDPIWKKLNAVKDGHVYVNVIDPLAQGGTAWSKINFLKAAVDSLSK